MMQVSPALGVPGGKLALLVYCISESGRQTVESIAAELAELAVSSIFTVIDGVGGSYEGVFEIIAVDAVSIRVLEPANT